MRHFTILSLLIFTTISFSQTKTEVQPFIADIVLQFPNVRDIAVSSNKDEVVFSAQSVIGDVSALVTVSKTKNVWGNPRVISFSGQYFDIEPFFSEDALSLYFASNRPLNASSKEVKDFDIWYVQRTTVDSEWSDPINLGAPINTEMDEFYPSITKSKNLYFTLDNKELKRKDDIYMSAFINGKYTEPKALGEGVNSDGYEFNAFVSQDESFIIYTCYNRKDGFGSGDLYISYKLEDENWGPSKNMGEAVNSDKMDFCPFVDLSSQTLYFTSKRIEFSSPQIKKINLKELQQFLNSYSNGASRLYYTPVDFSKGN